VVRGPEREVALVLAVEQVVAMVLVLEDLEEEVAAVE